jgi:hypothetical protein
MAPRKKPKGNPLDLLKTSTPAKKKGKKNTKPQVDLPGLKDAIQKFLDAAKAEKEAIARKKIAEQEIRPLAEDAKAEACQKSGSYDSSVILNGKVIVTQQNRFKTIATDEEDMLRRIFGDEQYDEFFGQTTKVAFTKDLLDDEEMLTKVLGAIQGVVGEEFGKFFEVKTYLEPNEAYAKARICNPEVREQAKRAEGEDLCVPYSATIKPH